MSVGPRLRRARLDAGLTLDAVFEITKVPMWILQAIERDDVAHVPGGVFIRGYLTSFARAVGLDSNEIVSSHFGPPPEPAPAPAPVIERPRYTGTPLWQVAALMVLIVATVIVWRDAWRTDVAAAEPAPQLATPAPPAFHPATPPVIMASNVAPPVAPVAPTEAKLKVQLHATGATWIEATSDGARQAYRMLQPGEDLQLNAQKEVHLRIGDAAAATYSVNGVPVEAPLGAAGVVRELTITP
jgi:cytoskeleton protein RodZ